MNLTLNIGTKRPTNLVTEAIKSYQNYMDISYKYTNSSLDTTYILSDLPLLELEPEDRFLRRSLLLLL